MIKTCQICEVDRIRYIWLPRDTYIYYEGDLLIPLEFFKLNLNSSFFSLPKGAKIVKDTIDDKLEKLKTVPSVLTCGICRPLDVDDEKPYVQEKYNFPEHAYALIFLAKNPKGLSLVHYDGHRTCFDCKLLIKNKDNKWESRCALRTVRILSPLKKWKFYNFCYHCMMKRFQTQTYTNKHLLEDVEK